MLRPVDPDADDFSARPWEYPGVPAERTGVLAGGHFHHVDADGFDDLLRERGGAELAARHLVVAVGSNASPSVVRRKLDRAGASTLVPFVSAAVHGLGVGHCSRVSTRGYLAAAPFSAPGHSAELFATFLDDEQLAALDATEPGYVRRRVSARDYPVELDGGGRPDSFWVYDSHSGVIASPGAEVVPLAPQQEIVDLLRAEVPGLDGSLGGGPVEEVTARLAGSSGLRDEVRSHLAATGWSTASGVAPSINRRGGS